MLVVRVLGGNVCRVCMKNAQDYQVRCIRDGKGREQKVGI